MQRIVVVGGGFGGIYAARHLERVFAAIPGVEIMLVSEENFLLFTPLLPEVASSSIEARHIISPARAFFRRVRFDNSKVLEIDAARRWLRVSHCATCEQREVPYDHLVLAVGATTNFFGLPGVADHALPMKTLEDAMYLRNQIVSRLEYADVESDPAARRALLTFVVVGGGFAGVETVAEIHDFVERALPHYTQIPPGDLRVVLIHNGPRIMPEISAELAGYALRKLRRKGIEVRLDTAVSAAGEGWVQLAGGESIATHTLVWAGGIAPNPLVAKLPPRRNLRGQIVVNEYLQVPGCRGLWALGDCAQVPNRRQPSPCPATAQFAVRQARTVAENVCASLRGAPLRAFSYAPVGVLGAIGRRSAVAQICGLKFSGFFAWWLWRTIYLFKLPGLERKIRVAMDWTMDLFFPRGIVLLKSLTRRKMPEAEREAVAGR